MPCISSASVRDAGMCSILLVRVAIRSAAVLDTVPVVRVWVFRWSRVPEPLLVVSVLPFTASARALTSCRADLFDPASAYSRGISCSTSLRLWSSCPDDWLVLVTSCDRSSMTALNADRLSRCLLVRYPIAPPDFRSAPSAVPRSL